MATIKTVGQYKALSPFGRTWFNQLLQHACTMAKTMQFDLFELYQESRAGDYISGNILTNAVIKLTDSSRDLNPDRKDTPTYLEIHGSDVIPQALEIIDSNLLELLDLITNPTDAKNRPYHDNMDLIEAIAHAAWVKQFLPIINRGKDYFGGSV